MLTAYNTLKRLYDYINNNFYNRSQSDARYDRRTDNIAGNRITSGINANNVTAGTLSSTRIPSLDASKITAGELNEDRIPEITRTKLSSNVRAILGNNALFFSSLSVSDRPGEWEFTFRFSFDPDVLVAYEVFIATNLTFKMFTLTVYNRSDGNNTDYVFYYNDGTKGGATSKALARMRVGDVNSGASKDRILCVKLTLPSARAMTRIDLAHATATNISPSRLYTLHSPSGELRSTFAYHSQSNTATRRRLRKMIFRKHPT